MIGLQPGHIVIVVLVALIFFAPSRLPMLVRGMKKMISEFRDETSDKSKKDNGADPDKTLLPPKK
jgi:Sec-independent protein translocase protein TatA